MEDLGLAHCVVGIQTSRLGPHHYSISQNAMTISLLAQFGLTNCKPASTPLPRGLKMTRSSDDETEEFSQKDLPYCSSVGSLMYLSQCTRPDISYAVGCLSQHLDRQCGRHWAALEHVMRYLSGTIMALISPPCRPIKAGPSLLTSPTPTGLVTAALGAQQPAIFS